MTVVVSVGVGTWPKRGPAMLHPKGVLTTFRPSNLRWPS